MTLTLYCGFGVQVIGEGENPAIPMVAVQRFTDLHELHTLLSPIHKACIVLLSYGLSAPAFGSLGQTPGWPVSFGPP
jgi:hypothetical protein